MADTIQKQLPVIISTMLLLLAIIGGFWSLADPRGELKNIRETYLTIREHNEFVSRFEKDILRLEDTDKVAFGKYAVFTESFANKVETREAIRTMNQQISQLRDDLSKLQGELRDANSQSRRTK